MRGQGEGEGIYWVTEGPWREMRKDGSGKGEDERREKKRCLGGLGNL